MKSIALMLIFCFCGFSINAQILQRTMLGSNGFSTEISSLKKTYYISQSVGQKSVIGTFNKMGYVIRQGFQQPPIVIKAIQTDFLLNVLVFPNPVDKKISIVLNEELTTNLTIVIYDILGRLKHREVKKTPSKFDLDLSFLSSGTYFLTLSANRRNQQYKLIKK
jgi:hypothetical protein